MISTVLLVGMLALGQPSAEGSADAPPVSPPAQPAPRLVMRTLRGTSLGEALDTSGLSISGWTEGSFTASTAGVRDHTPYGWNFLANNFLLQQNWLRLDRAVDPDATHATFGFRSDTILPGSDYRYTLPRGLWNGQLTSNNGRPQLYGFDPVQFYTEAYFPNIGAGLDVKFGRFFCQYGYESIDTTQNPFPSRSYTFIFNPFTNTGLVTTLKLDDKWTVQNGIVLGSDAFIDRVDNPTYIGSVKWAPPDGRQSLLLGTILGSGRYNPSQQFNNPQILDAVYNRKLTDDLTWVVEGLFGRQDNVPQIGTAYWWSIVNYAQLQLNSKLLAAARVEFFDDPQGQRTGFVALYSAFTGGLTWKPRDGLWIRSELRYDYAARARPFGGEHGLFTATMDCILRW
jgi:hypothetical protein